MAFGQARTHGFANPSKIFANILTLVGPNAKIVGPGFVFNNKGLFIYDTATAQAGHLIANISPADGANDGAGNAFFKGFNVYDNVGLFLFQMQAGLLRWGPFANYPTQLGSQSATAGLDQWQSSQSNLADTPAQWVARSKNNTGDAKPRFETRSAFMADLLAYAPNILNAANLETFHAFSFANGWTASATGATPGICLTPLGPSHAIIGGRINAPAAPAAGQAITNAVNAAVQPASVQSLTAWDVTGANANKQVRLFLTTTGILTFAGPIGNIAGNDDLDIPFQLVSLTQ